MFSLARTGDEHQRTIHAATITPLAQALENHRRLAQTIEEYDADALTYVEDITCDDNANLDGFTITFKFRENPYFSNTELKKTLMVSSLLSASNISIEKVRRGVWRLVLGCGHACLLVITALVAVPLSLAGYLWVVAMGISRALQ